MWEEGCEKERGWRLDKETVSLGYSSNSGVGSGHYMIDSMRTVGAKALGKGCKDRVMLDRTF